MANKKFDKATYDAAYRKRAYDTIQIQVPKGKRSLLKALAEDNGISMNKFIIRALEIVYDVDLS